MHIDVHAQTAIFCTYSGMNCKLFMYLDSSGIALGDFAFPELLGLQSPF